VFTSDRSTWRVKFWLYAPIIVWIGLIFFLSSPEGSFDETSRIIGPLLHFFFPSVSSDTEKLVHAIVRKGAHFTEYGILAFLAVRACRRSGSAFLQKWQFLLPVALAVVIASLDELNQSFEPSRTSSPLDVLLDVIGAATISFLFWWFTARRGK
jgi:VanZ family protein